MSRIPEPVLERFCRALAWLFSHIPSKRRYIIYSNLHHAFPERSGEWLRKTVWKVCKRTMEMGIFTIVCPHFSRERLASMFSVSEEVDRAFEKLLGNDRPIVIFGPHFSMMEVFNSWPDISRFEFPETAVMYRPHKNPAIDGMMKKCRERAGMKLVSRRAGIKEMGDVLKRNGLGVILFDQNTRDAGSLIPFFGRVTSATELPGLLVKKYNAIPVSMISYRTDFWRASLEFEVQDVPLEPGALTLASNQWIEDRMKQNEDLLVDWLWSHNRWKILFRPFERLGMNHRKKLVDFSIYEIRKTRFAVVHQDLSLSLDQAIRFLKALRISRPDAEITLITRDAEKIRSAYPQFIDIACDLPSERSEVKALARHLIGCYLDLVMVLDDDSQSRKFARLTKVPQRFGVKFNGRKDSALTDIWTPADSYAWQIEPEWIEFGKHFGLEVEGEG
jgi:heptosyltransferase II